MRRAAQVALRPPAPTAASALSALRLCELRGFWLVELCLSGTCQLTRVPDASSHPHRQQTNPISEKKFELRAWPLAPPGTSAGHCNKFEILSSDQYEASKCAKGKYTVSENSQSPADSRERMIPGWSLPVHCLRKYSPQPQAPQLLDKDSDGRVVCYGPGC
jgi:hypothetical protein